MCLTQFMNWSLNANCRFRMVKTNEWTVTDLIKYLVSIRDLNEEEIQRLRNTPAFPKEMTPDVKDTTRLRFMAHQLYPPVEVFRTLGLPILDWGEHVKWRDRSDEGNIIYVIICFPLLILCSKILIQHRVETPPPFANVDWVMRKWRRKCLPADVDIFVFCWRWSL